RLEALGALGGLDRAALASQVASALEVVIHLGRRDGRRALEEVAVLRRGSDGLLETATAPRVQEGRRAEGPGAEALARRPAGRARRAHRTRRAHAAEEAGMIAATLAVASVLLWVLAPPPRHVPTPAAVPRGRRESTGPLEMAHLVEQLATVISSGAGLRQA